MDPSCPVCNDTLFEIRTQTDGVSSAVPCACSIRTRGDRLLRASGIPRRYDHCSLDSFECHDPTTTTHAAAKGIATAWVEQWPLVERGLLFLGRPGTGKTHLAVAMARELARSKGARVLFYEQRQLLKEIQSTFDAGTTRSESDVLRPIFECDVLILDDVGAARTTPWARDVMHDVIVQRYNDRMLLILTSNHPLGEDAETDTVRKPEMEGLTLRDRLGVALVSRLHEMCRKVEIAGRDFRKEILQAGIHL